MSKFEPLLISHVRVGQDLIDLNVYSARGIAEVKVEFSREPYWVEEDEIKASFSALSGPEEALTRIKFEGSVMTFDSADAVRTEKFLAAVTANVHDMAARAEFAINSAERKLASQEANLQKYVND